MIEHYKIEDWVILREEKGYGVRECLSLELTAKGLELMINWTAAKSPDLAAEWRSADAPDFPPPLPPAMSSSLFLCSALRFGPGEIQTGRV